MARFPANPEKLSDIIGNHNRHEHAKCIVKPAVATMIINYSHFRLFSSPSETMSRNCRRAIRQTSTTRRKGQIKYKNYHSIEDLLVEGIFDGAFVRGRLA